MFETLGFESLTPVLAAAIFGLMVGCAFGALAQRSGLCLRRSLAGPKKERRPALGAWAMAMATAIAGTRLAVISGLISFSDHRFLAPDLAVVSLVVGGALFGAGMVMAGGCVSRLTVLAGTGNLRSLFALIIVAATAHATMKGALAPARHVLGGPTIQGGDLVAITSLPGGEIWLFAIAAFAIVFALRSGAPKSHLLMAAVIGLLIPLSWVGTGFLLQDDFDPLPVESLGFTGPTAGALFWFIAATSIPVGFGTGLVAGVLFGSMAASVAFGEFRLQTLDDPTRALRRLAGAVMMGVGGVLAGGCSVGAGLSGISTASLAAVLAVLAMSLTAKAVGNSLADS